MSTEIQTKLVSSLLIELPSELLGCILAQIETAQALSHLSLTCKGLHAIIEKDGYRMFVQSRFPSIPLPTSSESCANGAVQTAQITPKFWKDAAHGLTSLSRNFDRRAFVAQSIQDPESRKPDRIIGTFRRRRRYGPGMGFVPVIDSYEAWYGGDWASRKEVVAWGAGAKLVVRSKNRGTRREDVHGKMTDETLKTRWQTYSKQGAHDGLDDITTLDILLRDLSDREDILVGRASGELERILIDGGSGERTLATYVTHGMPVRRTTVHHRDTSIAAACLGDHTVAIYPLDFDGEDVTAYLDTAIQKANENIRTWSIKFLKEGRVAVGFGRSNQPISILDLGQSSLTVERAIDVSFKRNGALNRSDDAHSHSPGTSVYSIALLPPSTSSGAEGDVFLSGGYDAHIRLHDLRVENTVVSLYSDPVDASSAIYSLLPIGQERFIAGGALHSLIKVFDLRMPGQRLYHAADALPCSQNCYPTSKDAQSPQSCGIQRRCTFHASVRNPRNWNVFLGARSYGHDQSLESSVYSLSRPSSVSPVVYAGLQNCITQLDIVSVLDQNPDPIYNPRPYSMTSSHTRVSPQVWPATSSYTAAKARGMDEAGRKWDPKQQVLNLTMYEQADPVSAFLLPKKMDFTCLSHPQQCFVLPFTSISYYRLRPIILYLDGHQNHTLNIWLLQVTLMHQQPVRSTCFAGIREEIYHGLDERWGGAGMR